jgi:type IV secretion system protein TrbL
VHLSPIATAAFATFLQWGTATGGTPLTAQSFMQPSTVVNLDFQAATPIKMFVDRLAGWTAMWNFFHLACYTIAWWIIVISFAFVALHLMMTTIEYHMAVLAGTVLIPWGCCNPRPSSRGLALAG